MAQNKPSAPIRHVERPVRLLAPATSRLQCWFFCMDTSLQYFFFYVCCKIKILTVPDLSPTKNSNFEQPVSYMGSQVQTGHSKYMSREKIAFLADLRSRFSIQIYFQVNPAVKSMDWMDWMKCTEWISIFIIVKLLAPCKRLQLCWPKTPNNVWSYCVSTFARSLTLLRRLGSYTTRMERCICIQSSLDPFGFHLKLRNW